MRGAPYGLVAALTFVSFADEWAAFLPSGSLEQLRRDIGLSYAEAGAVVVSLSAGGLVGNVLIVAADYVSRRVIAAAGALAYGGAMIAFGVAQDFWTLAIAGLIWGAASDAFIHGCQVALVDLAQDDPPSALAKANAWSAVGDLLGPLTLAALALAGWSWRDAFLGLGVLFLAYGAWIATLKLPPPHPSETRSPPLTAVIGLLRDPQVLALALVLGLLAVLDEPLHGFLIAYLERVRGLPPQLATAPVLANVVGCLAGFGAYERLTRDRSDGQIVLASALVCTAALPAAIFVPEIIAQCLTAALFGVALAVLYTALDARALHLRPGQAGTTSAVISMIGMAGSGFPVLAGSVADRVGLTGALALYGVIPVLILAALALLRRRSARRC